MERRRRPDFPSYVFGRASNVRPSGNVARVHAGKLSYGQLAGALIESRLLVRADDGWLEGPEWVVAHLMSYLALQIFEHSRQPLPLITNELAAARTMVGPVERTTMSRKVRAVTKLLPVPADAQIRHIEEFRNRHREELLRFRTYIDGLIMRDQLDDDGDASFARRLSDAEEVRAHLQGEMRSFDWVAQAIPISITAVSAAAAPLDHAPWTLGAGLFGVGILGAQALAFHRRRGRALKNRMVYAANVADRWPMTTARTMW